MIHHYKVVTDGAPDEVWAIFDGERGRAKAEAQIADGYWHKLMKPEDRHKRLLVVPVTP